MGLLVSYARTPYVSRLSMESVSVAVCRHSGFIPSHLLPLEVQLNFNQHLQLGIAFARFLVIKISKECQKLTATDILLTDFKVDGIFVSCVAQGALNWKRRRKCSSSGKVY